MTDNELLLAISDMLDKKLNSELAPIRNDITSIKLTLENNVLPRLQNIESCYTSTYERYKNEADSIDGMKEDIALLKKVVREHSAKLEKVS
ncbi:hypothetical protein H8S37_04455 [Mediterraneibacter sp. NSJ-55]|uniref:Uncharacterized protein n=1 Tax=Mediterraneibacter hominis TaxID=2763054 RepID=A0A923RP80_9FIRM|nr:hypothetical protein [Mediterraneibacter hominis]MBC5688185.1 hypothetical protein [Mediterraneibacter hominis]